MGTPERHSMVGVEVSVRSWYVFKMGDRMGSLYVGLSGYPLVASGRMQTTCMCLELRGSLETDCPFHSAAS